MTLYREWREMLKLLYEEVPAEEWPEHRYEQLQRFVTYNEEGEAEMWRLNIREALEKGRNRFRSDEDEI